MSRKGARTDRATGPGQEPVIRWIGLEEACRRLGVSPTTLRRWSDHGLVETFVTPGGHRRFDADSVRRLLPARGGRPTMERLGETPERISRAYRRAGRDGRLVPWLAALDERERIVFRDHGHAIARELLATLDAPTDADRAGHLAAAAATAAAYGVAAAEHGIPASTTVQTFLAFRRPFLIELVVVARRRGLDTTAATELVVRASDAVDELLVATMRAHEAEAARRPTTVRRPTTARAGAG